MRGRLTAATTILVAVALTGCGQAGTSTPRSTVDTYLHALSANDEKGIRRIAEPFGQNSKIEPQVRDQLRQYGGKKIHVESVEMANSLWRIADSACSAVVRGRADGKDYSSVIHLQLQSAGGWLISDIDDSRPPADAPPCKA